MATRLMTTRQAIARQLEVGLEHAAKEWLDEIWVFAVETDNMDLRQDVESELMYRGIWSDLNIVD